MDDIDLLKGRKIIFFFKSNCFTNWFIFLVLLSGKIICNLTSWNTLATKDIAPIKGEIFFSSSNFPINNILWLVKLVFEELKYFGIYIYCF